MKTLTAQFQARVEEFLRRTGFKETEFGRQAVSDPTLLLDLRRGRSPKLETADRILAFIEAYDQAQQERDSDRRKPILDFSSMEDETKLPRPTNRNPTAQPQISTWYAW